MTGRFFVLSLGVFCAATSVVMTKASQLAPEYLSAGRLFVGSLILLPIFLNDKKKYPDYKLEKGLLISGLPALLLALHFITWTIGARLTTSANSTLIVNLVPIAMPFFGYLVVKETLTKNETIGTVLALAGILILGFADFHLSPDLLAGDLVCLVSMLLMAWYLILARKYTFVPSIWLYLVPLYFIAGLLCLITGAVRTGIPNSFPLIEVLWILLLGIIPTVFGHSLLNLAMRWYRSQFVAIMMQLQFLYAGILGFFFFKEIPTTSFYLASACMMAGVFWILYSQKKPTPQ